RPPLHPWTRGPHRGHVVQESLVAVASAGLRLSGPVRFRRCHAFPVAGLLSLYTGLWRIWIPETLAVARAHAGATAAVGDDVFFNSVHPHLYRYALPSPDGSPGDFLRDGRLRVVLAKSDETRWATVDRMVAVSK